MEPSTLHVLNSNLIPLSLIHAAYLIFMLPVITGVTGEKQAHHVEVGLALVPTVVTIRCLWRGTSGVNHTM